MKLRFDLTDVAEDGITVTFPDLPGCITCGYSLDEAKQMAKEALMLYLEDMIEDTIPKTTQIRPVIQKPSEQVFLI
ncbi:type II toxin-antitoxin system HicB family antitoxin [Paenibacillus wynnii]|uniref:type II toxin-antitoxin system HicB family antitoxin n=1 Tax=Paenibacillus wynnii TaxID=268407 RepID=UPI0027911E29|nr:type II toxin-antitoxin system HicB family antitoxin [Paenibacillus wynnii]MDQ0192060.1 putative RNase H-like HicB family nuclease [Paenibacillus wynnii]